MTRHDIVLVARRSQLLDWCTANSIESQVCAFDLDGVICHDAESGGTAGTPLNLPRRHPVHIITRRGEVHRAVTETRRRRWGVQVASLTMGPWDDCPEWERIAEYKVEAVRAFAATAHDRPFGPPIYVESCPKQAVRIAERSGVMVVGLTSGDVWGRDAAGCDCKCRTSVCPLKASHLSSVQCKG